MSAITSLKALEILDSRGNPTLQVTAELASGAKGSARVPSGASTGINEAVELRDEDQGRYAGKGVLKARDHVNGEILAALEGFEAGEQRAVDDRLIAMDGTPNKGRLGANAILGVSMAVAHAMSAEQGLPLYQSLARSDRYTLPVPMFNIMNGGQHADNNVDIQEFMILPVGLGTFAEALRAAAETFHALKSILKAKSYGTAVGDEGGFAPELQSNEEPMELLVDAIGKAGYKPGEEIFIGLDAAASEFYSDGSYVFDQSDGSRRDAREMAAMWSDWAAKYPLISLEDGFSETDHDGWKSGTERLGKQLQLVGDDLFVTNPKIFEAGISDRLGNSILIKLNQIGTVTETLDCIELARENNYTFIISHRSGETADTTIADLAVACGGGQIKTGSTCRSDRVAKYNRLLEIESELGSHAAYAGKSAFASWL
ncbi:MAG: phosphopyruvate hydratase [Bryobacterales bacterium]|nr:phosphopyruvate hydratase [Bryobacterales bacterium]